jgi:hypothetical protein
MKTYGVAAEYMNRTQAEMAKTALDARGIPSFIRGDDLGGQGPGQSFVNRVQVLVDAENLDTARALLSGE